jgi:LysW-gamma-L-lysine/LysW-L-ornithine aminotransferase
MKDYLTIQGLSLVGTYANRGLTLTEGEGIWLKTPAGDKYMDLMTNYGVNIFGYGHPEITESLIAQLRRLTTLHGSFANDMRADAARALLTRCGGGLSRVYFSNSGAEAVEAALKFAVLATGRKRFIRCRHGYHGKTLGALSATDGVKYRSAFEPLIWDFAVVPYDDVKALASALDDRTAAVLIEPIQGEGGIYPSSPGYLKAAKDLCQAAGALLIVDEIQTGMGRTGTFLASHPEGLKYDMVTLGKGLAGGIPTGATLVSAAVAERIPKSSHTSTCGGNPLSCAGILAALRVLDEPLLNHVREMGDYFAGRLRTAGLAVASEIRGRGLMLGVRVRAGRDLILRDLQRAKILTAPAGDDVIRFLPPFIIKKEELDLAMEGIVRAFGASGTED